MIELSTCVAPEGRFVVGVHRAAFRVANFREKDYVDTLGITRDRRPYTNQANFPAKDVIEENADRVYEIRNPFPFRGVTYIAGSWADKNAAAPERICLPSPPRVSFMETVGQWSGGGNPDLLLALLPESLQLALATTTTDPDDLVRLAAISCDFVMDRTSGRPAGLYYSNSENGPARPEIRNEKLFEAVANNPRLPDDYKRVMVLRPGAQGGSEITAEWRGEDSGHVFEYLRRNSYIPWGHYAANMADDAVRYRISDLTPEDVRGMRHLYYQRTFVRIAEILGLDFPERRRTLTEGDLEHLRGRILEAAFAADKDRPLPFDATVWGWNFGFDYAPTGYRLHASHQQTHQQFALTPAKVETLDGQQIPSYSCGDLVAEFIQEYFRKTGRQFFEAYLEAIDNNTRTDGRSGESSLAVYRDDNVLLFVPKAQTSQWELQLMTVKPVANILQADTGTRRSLDRGIHTAVRVLGGLGARMITTIEYAGRIASTEPDQRLIYSFLPRLPESPGAFSEAQLRWINGHYPEDFASACRKCLSD
ncbi:MAG: hypothetical protein AB1724_17890 [Thermodesulfobacteriota bacterium]